MMVNPEDQASQAISYLQSRLPDLTDSLPKGERPERRFSVDDTGRLNQTLWFEHRSTMEKWFNRSVQKPYGSTIKRTDFLPSESQSDLPVMVVLTLTPGSDARRLDIMSGTMNVYEADHYVRRPDITQRELAPAATRT